MAQGFWTDTVDASARRLHVSFLVSLRTASVAFTPAKQKLLGSLNFGALPPPRALLEHHQRPLTVPVIRFRIRPRLDSQNATQGVTFQSGRYVRETQGSQ